MKKIFVTIFLSAIFFCSHSCGPSPKKEKATPEKELRRRILQHFNQKNYDVKDDKFTAFIGTTKDLVEFKENGKVYLRLSKDNQVFDITQKQQQHRLQGLKNLMLQPR